MSALARAPALRPVLRTHRDIGRVRHISNSLYDKTINNIKINENTRVIYQGFTGKAATLNAQQTIQYGTNIVGGVTPGKSGTHLDLPLFPTVAEAAKELKPDATALFVAAPYAASAIEEAIAAEIPLIVAVAEHVPLHDMLRVHSMLRTQSKSRLIGANCPGIVNPNGHCRIGFMPHPSFLPGSIGIAAKSGTLSYEAVASTTRVGLGQSLVVGVGGDAVAGTTLAEAVGVFLEDDKTEGIVIIGEVGGDTELEAAELVREYRQNGGTKPVMALLGGKCAVEGRIMGHAGALRGFHATVEEKARAFENAGIKLVQHPGQFGEGMMKLLGRPLPREPVKGMGPNGPQRRGLHTMARRRPEASALPPVNNKRSFYTKDEGLALKVLEKFAPNIHVSTARPKGPTYSVGISVNGGSIRSPALVVGENSESLKFFPFEYLGEPPAQEAYTFLRPGPHISFEKFRSLVNKLNETFLQLKLYSLHFEHVSGGTIHLHKPDSSVIRFDHSAPLPIDAEGPETFSEKEAAKYGIVYVTLPGEGNIGTLVNGAGLAMNTCDVINAHGGSPANFLDTGGKATGRTVVEGMRQVLADPRVKAIFVNIFGGLTDCKMIGEGILMAYKELDMENLGIPLVVRLRGTNEEIGQKLIKESGLPVLAFHELDGAVEKVIELAKTSQRVEA